MKRIAPSVLSVFTVAVLLGVTGCDSGGIETGVPSNTDASQGVPKDKLPALAPIIPPGTKKPGDAKGATAPAATPEASKEATPK